ncbi:SDR family oxidoreductase [Nocardioides sp. TF02-7]|uniref:SDR family NAD(P)-dependent oxidoreductase n=1 Tax=Nocardioides sp. TF02-7 TaxID=2917724 RepID=UPI001F06EC89|nr:SDR family oxidoreductase [Nocardioides sp. TF02-7]UMG92726.1 SDR family oxidoreductase [Nocardioides sp. TF02-7]
MTEARGRASALVTGASRGIGLGIAEMLARRGTALTITARDEERLADVSGHLRELGAPEVVPVAGDLADPALPDVLGKRHAEAFGDLGCLVLNAGVGTAAPIGDLPEARLDKTLAVNLRAPVLLLQRLLPLLRAADRARVVVLSSISGVYAEPGLAAYGATKAALNSLVETLNAEESGNGVSATAIAPRLRRHRHVGLDPRPHPTRRDDPGERLGHARGGAGVAERPVGGAPDTDHPRWDVGLRSLNSSEGRREPCGAT